MSTTNDSDERSAEPRNDIDQDANLLIGSGIGVGVFGLGTTLLTGAVCPLCYVIPPGLIAVGIAKKVAIRKRRKSNRN